MIPSKLDVLIGALPHKRQMFVREYLIDLNATQAAIRAGYSKKTAKSQGNKLLTFDDVADAIQAAMDDRAERLGKTADDVIREVAKIAFFDIRKAFNADGTLKRIDEMDDSTASGIASLDVSEPVARDGETPMRYSKLRVAGKTENLTLLMRHMGLLNDKVRLQGDAENPLAMLIKEVQGNAIKPIQNPSDAEGE